MPNEQQQINFTDTKPIFADDIAIIHRIKSVKMDKGEIEKEGTVMFVFLDAVKHQAIGEFVVNIHTAEALAKMLPENLKALEKNLADKSLPPTKPPSQTTSDMSYTR